LLLVFWLVLLLLGDDSGGGCTLGNTWLLLVHEVGIIIEIHEVFLLVGSPDDVGTGWILPLLALLELLGQDDILIHSTLINLGLFKFISLLFSS